jgi:phage gpG-like protein
MASGAEVQVDSSELVAAVAELRARGASPAPAMRVVAEMLVGRVNEEYETAGHGLWPGLAPSTLKKRRGNVAQILVNSGRAAASTFSDSGEDFAEAATDVDYMKFHASTQPRTKIPYRNPFDLVDMDDVNDEATEIILAHVTGEGT